MKPKRYTINAQTYTQGPLVLGQLIPLCDLIEGLKIPAFTVQAIVKSLGPKLSMAMAIVLVPKDQSVKGRDITALAETFEDHMPIDTALEVVADFLDFNPVSSLLERIQGITGKITVSLKAIPSEGSLPAEVPPSGTQARSSSESSMSSPAET